MGQKPQQIVDDTSAYVRGWKLFAIITCLYFGSFLLAIDINIINVAIPQIATDFKALDGVAWYGTAYLLLITVMQPVYGSLYKHFSNDVVYKISIVIFEIGSVLCAAAVNSPMFIAGRAIAGFGGAGLLQGALSIISQVVKLEQRALYNGIVISVFVVTNAIGPILGGVFTEKATWRWCFWINLPIGGLVLLGLTFFLKVGDIMTDARKLPLKQKLNNLDPLGSLVFLGAICALLLGLQWGGQTKPWSSPDVIGCLVGSVLILALFFFIQWKKKEKALIPLRILAKRSIWTSGMVLFFLGAQVNINSFFTSFWFQAVLQQTPVQTGINFIALLVPQMIVVIIVAGIIKKYGYYVPFMLVGEIIAIGGQAMLTQLHPNTTTLFWAASFVVTGIGAGIAQQLPYTAIAVVLSDQDIPVGNAIAVLLSQLGGAVAISMGQTIVVSTITDQLPGRLPDLNPQLVLSAGATNLPKVAPLPAVLAILIDIWNTGIVRTMILSTVCVAMTIPFTLGMEWLNAVKIGEQRRQESSGESDDIEDVVGSDEKSSSIEGSDTKPRSNGSVSNV